MELEPLKLHPCYKEYLWGGDRLKREYGKTDAPEITAESWELACHWDGTSLVESGPFAGQALVELDRQAYWGTDCPGEEFPILVKLIDAARDLSIQVHPSDKTALPEKGERGKAEMWYVVDCKPQSFIYFGFKRKISPKKFRAMAAAGTICNVLNKVPVAKGDVFYIIPGTVHAIGAGILIAEIQQNSNTTFRIYDYDRKDANGKTRPLHIDRAAEVVSYDPIIPAECRFNSLVTFPEFEIREMFSCRFFRSYRIDVRRDISLSCDGRSFQHLLCVDGVGAIQVGSVTYPYKRGDSYFLPAAMGDYKLLGSNRVLLSRV